MIINVGSREMMKQVDTHGPSVPLFVIVCSNAHVSTKPPPPPFFAWLRSASSLIVLVFFFSQTSS